MSSYLGISAIDNGIIRLGNNGYGGIAYRAGAFGEGMRNEEGTSENRLGGTRDPTRRFLTEQNLALFWRRPGILPSTRGLLNPLLDTQSVPGQSGLYNRPPGNIRHDCPPIRYRGRNLLAGQILQEKQDTVRLWALNDFSDHKLLLQYDLRIKEGESEETGDGRRHKCIKVRASKNGPKQLRLRDAADQLRAMEDGGEGQRVFVRTKCYLQLAEMGGLDEDEETEEDAASKSNIVYKCPAIRSFAQIPHMEDEIAIVDGRGQLFWGRLDDANSFSRAIKSIEPILEVCPTDCPRLLLSLSAQELREVDLREPPGAAPGHLLHSLSPLAEFNSPFGQRICDQISARDKFWHLAVPDIQLETAMVTTTRQHMLVDRRMPGLLLLAMEHTELGGADYCLTVPAFTDPESGSRIFSHYALTHVRRPALSHWSFAFHPKEALWSSLGPKYEMDSPRSMITNIYRPHTQPIGFDPASLPQHTRAIHYQPLHPGLRLSSTRALLFRQMEGGEIWFENVFFDPLPKLRQNGYLDTALEEMGTYEGDYGMEPFPEEAFRNKCLARIRHFQSGKAGNEEAFYKEIDKKLLAEPKFQKISALELLKNEATPTMPNIPSGESDSMDPFATLFEINEPKVNFYNEEEGDLENRLAATISGIGDDRLFSKCVNKIWEKTSPLCEERAKHRVNKVVEQHIGGHKVGPASLARNADQMDDEEMEDEQENRREEEGGNGEEEEAEFRAKMDELKIFSGMKGSEHLEMASKKRRRMDTDEKLWMAGEVEEKSDKMSRKKRSPTKKRPSAGGPSNLATPTELKQQAMAMESRSKMQRKTLLEEDDEEIGGDEPDERDGDEAPSSDNGNDDEYNFDVDLDNLY